MARFAAAYTRPDGTSPAWGDADDARALPLGGQQLGDHRYLGATMAAAWGCRRAGLRPAQRDRLAAGARACRGARRDGGAGVTALRRRRLRDPAGGRGPRLRRLRSRRARRPRRPRPQRHHGARRNARRHPAPPRPRHLHVYALARVAESVPDDRGAQRRPGRRRGAELGSESHITCGACATTPGPSNPSSEVDGPRRTFRVGHTGYRRLAAPVRSPGPCGSTPRARARRHRRRRGRSDHELSVRYTLPPGAELELEIGGALLVVAGREFAVAWSGWRP